MDDKTLSSQRTINMKAEQHPVAPDLPAPQRREATPHRVKVTLKMTPGARRLMIPQDKDGKRDLSAYYPDLDEAVVECQEGKFRDVIASTAPLRSKFQWDERVVCFRAEVTEGGIEIGERLALPLWW